MLKTIWVGLLSSLMYRVSPSINTWPTDIPFPSIAGCWIRDNTRLNTDLKLEKQLCVEKTVACLQRRPLLQASPPDLNGSASARQTRSAHNGTVCTDLSYISSRCISITCTPALSFTPPRCPSGEADRPAGDEARGGAGVGSEIFWYGWDF